MSTCVHKKLVPLFKLNSFNYYEMTAFNSKSFYAYSKMRHKFFLHHRGNF